MLKYPALDPSQEVNDFLAFSTSLLKELLGDVKI